MPGKKIHIVALLVFALLFLFCYLLQIFITFYLAANNLLTIPTCLGISYSNSLMTILTKIAELTPFFALSNLALLLFVLYRFYHLVYKVNLLFYRIYFSVSTILYIIMFVIGLIYVIIEFSKSAGGFTMFLYCVIGFSTGYNVNQFAQSPFLYLLYGFIFYIFTLIIFNLKGIEIMIKIHKFHIIILKILSGLSFVMFIFWLIFSLSWNFNFESLSSILLVSLVLVFFSVVLFTLSKILKILLTDSRSKNNGA